MEVKIVEDISNTVSYGLVACVSLRKSEGRLTRFDDVTAILLTRRKAKARPAPTPLREKLENNSIVSRRAIFHTYVVVRTVANRDRVD